MSDLNVNVRETGAHEAASALKEINEAAEQIKKGIDAISANAILELANKAREAGRELVELAVHFEETERALTRLGAAWDQVRAATNDTMSAMDASRAQQRLLQAGFEITGSDLAAIAARAREFSHATGEEMPEVMNRLTTALMRGSERGLRPFGLATHDAAGNTLTFRDHLHELNEEMARGHAPANTLGENLSVVSRHTTEWLGSVAMGILEAQHFSDTLGVLARRFGDVGTAVHDNTQIMNLEAGFSDEERRGMQQAAPGTGPTTNFMGMSQGGQRTLRVPHHGAHGRRQRDHLGFSIQATAEMDVEEYANNVRTSKEQYVRDHGDPLAGGFAQFQQDRTHQQQLRSTEAHMADAQKAMELARHQQAQLNDVGAQMANSFHNNAVHTMTSAQTMADSVHKAFGSMTNAIVQHAKAAMQGKETIGQALEGMLSQTLESVGEEALVKAAFFTAEAIGDAASVVLAAKVPGDLAAAAAYGAVGALALGAGVAMSGAGGAPSGGGGGAPSSMPAMNSPGGSDRGGGDSHVTYNVNVSGTVFTSGEDLSRGVAQAINNGRQIGVVPRGMG